LVAAVAVGILPGAHDRLLGDAEYIAAAATVTLGGSDDFLMTSTGGNAAFDARHGGSPLSSERHHGLDRGHVGFMDRRRTAQLALVLGGFLGQDVALESLATLDGSAAANLKALRRAFLGLHLGHDDSYVEFKYMNHRCLALFPRPPCGKARLRRKARVQDKA